MSTSTRLLALAGWVIAAMLTVLSARCVRAWTVVDPARKPYSEADLHTLYAEDR